MVEKKPYRVTEAADGSVRVATYLTELPPRELLEAKLLQSIAHARARASSGQNEDRASGLPPDA